MLDKLSSIGQFGFCDLAKVWLDSTVSKCLIVLQDFAKQSVRQVGFENQILTDCFKFSAPQPALNAALTNTSEGFRLLDRENSV